MKWQPTFYFKKNKHEIIACEVSEKRVYPAIFKMVHHDIIDIPITIHCYAICKENVCIAPKNQKEFAELIKHGHGLLSANAGLVLTERAHSTPCVFHISEKYRDELLKGAVGKFKTALSAAYETYKKDPLSGVKELCDLLEQLVDDAVDGSKKKFGIKIKKNLTTHEKCSALISEAQLNNAKAAIAAMMGFYSTVRNPSSHAPRNAKDAHTKYRLCRENFVQGFRLSKNFVQAFKTLGIKL